jgi:transposase InsO family protein
MRFSIATAWSSAAAGRATARAARRCPQAPPPMNLWCADFKGEFKLGNGRYC